MGFRNEEEQNQPGKPQWVYFIQQGDTGPIKIGISADPKQRLAVLQTAQTEPLRLLATEPGGKAKEEELHSRFLYARIQVLSKGQGKNRTTEWFFPDKALLQYIEELQNVRGLQGISPHLPSNKPTKGFRS